MSNNSSKLLALAWIIALAACQSQEESSDAYGNFEATATVIGTETGGKLLVFDVEEGETLEGGALIAQFDTTLQHLEKMKVRAMIDALNGKLRTASDDIRVLEENRANLVRERDRLARLVERNAATTRQLDDIKGQIDVVDRQIVALETQTETANTAILSERGPLLAQLEILDEQIRRSSVNNPVKGTVLTKLAEQFEILRPGSALYRIAQLDTMTFKFYVDAVQLQELVLGDDIDVFIDSGPNSLVKISGSVSWISSEAEFTPRTIQTREDRVNLVYAIKALVPNPDGRLKMGMPGEVRFEQ